MEIRVANAFIERGLSPQKVRRAIEIAREMLMQERTLSTARFKTDGRTVFLQVLKKDGADQMINLFRNQHVFREIIEPSLRNIDFDDSGIPLRWWPHGKQARIVVDPHRAFGRIGLDHLPQGRACDGVELFLRRLMRRYFFDRVPVEFRQCRPSL